MKKVCVLLAMVMFLGACGLTKEDLGMARSKPDETKVVSKKKALVIPPFYDEKP